MSVAVVIGSQWGDEGKGKIVDVFAAKADLIVRYQGGANAGHTLIVNNKKTVLHLVPSGVLHDQATCVIGAGVVLDIQTLADEIFALKENGYLQNPDQLLISDSCTVLLPYHRRLDQAREKALKHDKIGTTGKGIGPAYEDRAARKAILFGDLFDETKLRARIEASLLEKNFLLEKFYEEEPVDVDEILQHVAKVAKHLEPYRCRDVSNLIWKAKRSGKRILFEGAQGTLLDLLHGTYPFVTSSSTISGSACIGAGLGPGVIDNVIGITKAYTTRIGSGPFVTELFDEVGERIQKVGGEFGATTGRRRRCGWLDLVALRYAIRLNGITNIALTKIDVLSGLKEINVCTHYELDGKTIDDFPISTDCLERSKPVYKTLPGWDEDITTAKSLKELPKNAQDYIGFIAQELGVPIDVVAVGPDREQTLWIKPLFN